MARDFFPFVEENTNQDEKNTGSDNSLTVRYAARIAVYDDKAAAPRVVLVEPKDVRKYPVTCELHVVRAGPMP